ncbi:putative ankyrin repeat protein [Rostrohypoxylon terebratum]|nr:putative ankyrin repeat protein [Rostrohypoxylon terebratum]
MMAEPNSSANETAPEASEQKTEVQASAVGSNALNDKEEENKQDPPTDLLSDDEPEGEKALPLGPESKEHKLGLDINSPWGWSGSDYDDYDVVTVHGIRDDYKTSWTDHTGAWWVKDQLFQKLSIREVDYSYEIHEESELYAPNGINRLATSLIDEYAQLRSKLMETETDRPIIWICHDLGGTIVKEALSIATDNPKKYGKVPMLTTAIIFLGTPHRSDSQDFLEDQLHKLVLHPGPNIDNMVINKVKGLATQVKEINQYFLDSKLLDRVTIFNVYSGARANRTPEDPPDPVTPFEPYTLFLGNSFGASGRIMCKTQDLVDLVRGERDPTWVFTITEILNSNGFNLRVNYQILNFQIMLHSLAAPTRTWVVPMEPGHPFTEWVYEQKPFKIFFGEGMGVRLMHLHANGHPSINIAEASRRFYLDYDIKATYFKYKSRISRSTIYFEFDQHDSRYDKISSLLTCLINNIAWRFWNDISDLIREELQFLKDMHSWSLEDLYHLYSKFRSMTAAVNLTIFIGCFDQCPEKERRWFLERVLQERDYCEKRYRLIISTQTKEGLAVDCFPDEARINLEHCSAAHMSIDRLTEDLRSRLSGLVERRPIYQPFRSQLDDLLEKCGNNLFLRQIILNWLENNLRGQPTSVIAKKIGEFSPPTTENVIRIIITSLEPTLQMRAKNVFNWVKHASEPWSPGSLIDALIIHESGDEDPYLDDINFSSMMDEIEKELSGIITNKNGYIMFSHPSFYCVPELCIEGDPKDWASKVNSTLTTIFLRYLQNKNVRVSPERLSSETTDAESPGVITLDTAKASPYPRNSLFWYAVLWPQHYRASGEFKPKKLVHQLFSSRETRFGWEFLSWLSGNSFTRIQRSYISTLPVFAMLGLEDLVEEATRPENRKPSFEKNCWLAITEAARTGYERIIQLLLEQVTIDVDELQTALHWAAASSNTNIIKILVKKIPDLDTFEWPENIIFQIAAAGLNDLLSTIPRSCLDINKIGSLWRAPPLTIATWRGHTSTVNLMLRLDPKPDLTIKDIVGDSVITTAAQGGDPRLAETLLQGGANLETTNENGTRAIEKAIISGAYKTLDTLLKGGYGDTKSKPDGGEPPLVLAAELGMLECVRVLLNHGADPNIECESGTALYKAVSWDHIDVVRLLFEWKHKPDMNVIPEGQRMLLIRAVGTGNTELVSLLIDNGAEIDFVDPDCSYAKTPLCRACKEGDLEMVKLLLGKGAGINYTGGSSDSPLFTALIEMKSNVAEYLLQVEGVDVHWTDADKLGSLHAAISQHTIIPKLLKMGAPIDWRSNTHGTPLHYAAKYGLHETIEVLLENDPRPDLESPYSGEPSDDPAIGCTALQLSCVCGHPKCLEVLLKAGANPNYENKGMDAIDLIFDSSGSWLGNQNGEDLAQECIKILLSGPYKVPIEHSNRIGPTRLHNITGNTPISLVKILVEAKAQLDIPNEDGYTPLAVAISGGNENVARYLVERGASINTFNPIFGSILHFAVSKGMLDLVKLLLKMVTDPETVDPKYGKSLLYTALEIPDHRNLKKMVRYLVEDAKVSVNKRGGNFGYPIILLGHLGTVDLAHPDLYVQLMKYLIRHKAQVDVSDYQGRRAAHFAGLWPKDDGLEVLNEAGAELDAKDKFGRMPIHFAASQSKDTCLKYLADKFENRHINVADNDNWTPLLWAARSGGPDIIEEIMRRNPDLNVRGRGYDNARWSVIKLIKFAAKWDNLIDELNLKERVDIDQDEEEEWVKPGHTKSATCESCLVPIIGMQWKCIECAHGFSLCFKCFGYRTDIHDPDHIFTDVGPLYEETTPPPADDTILSDDFDLETLGEEVEVGL